MVEISAIRDPWTETGRSRSDRAGPGRIDQVHRQVQVQTTIRQRMTKSASGDRLTVDDNIFFD